jgi:hypothetical protein
LDNFSCKRRIIKQQNTPKANENILNNLKIKKSRVCNTAYQISFPFGQPLDMLDVMWHLKKQQLAKHE